jgi:hypothetical protein
MVSGSTMDQPRQYVAIGEWVFNGPADVGSSYMVSGSTMDQPMSFPAI